MILFFAPPAAKFTRMEPITLQQLQEMFAGLRTEGSWNPDDEMLWGYYFTSANPEVLESVGDALEERGFEVAGIFENEDEPIFTLQAQRTEKHTPESLFALNNEFEALAATFEAVEYDGMDVNPYTEDEGCGCGCSCNESEEEGCCKGEGCCEEGGCEDCKCEEESQEGDHGCGCGRSHYHGEHQPIENPELLAAIDALAKEKSSEAEHALASELQRGLFLVPVFAGRIDTDPADEESVQVLVCTDQDDAEFLPLFTDEPTLKSWATGGDVSAMVLTAPEAWDFILSQSQCAGAVVNPGSQALPLNRELIGIFKKSIDDSQAEAE